MADVRYGIDIEATDKASPVLDKIGGMMKGLVGIAVFKGMIDSARESVNVLKQMDAVLASTGGTVGITKEEITKLASEIQKTTGIQDEAIMSGQNMLLTFKSIKGDVFKEATQAMTDLSASMNGGVVNSENMRSTAIQLGKALNDPIQGLTALRRVGIQFTESQKEQIKALTESGQKMQAQKIILAELKSQFGGSAEAYADPWKKMQTAIEDVGEGIGKKLLPLLGQTLPLVMQIAGAVTSLGETTVFRNFIYGVRLIINEVTIVLDLFKLMGIGLEQLAITSKIVWNKIKGNTEEVKKLQLDYLKKQVEGNQILMAGDKRRGDLADEYMKKELDGNNKKTAKLIANGNAVEDAYEENARQRKEREEKQKKAFEKASDEQMEKIKLRLQEKADIYNATDIEILNNQIAILEQELANVQLTEEAKLRIYNDAQGKKLALAKAQETRERDLVNGRVNFEKEGLAKIDKLFQENTKSKIEISRFYAKSFEEITKQILTDYLSKLEWEVVATTAAGVSAAVSAKNFNQAGYAAAQGAVAVGLIETAKNAINGSGGGGGSPSTPSTPSVPTTGEATSNINANSDTIKLNSENIKVDASNLNINNITAASLVVNELQFGEMVNNALQKRNNN
jgi:hypothetical protein